MTTPDDTREQTPEAIVALAIRGVGGTLRRVGHGRDFAPAVLAALRDSGWVDPDTAKTLQDECQVDLDAARFRTAEEHAKYRTCEEVLGGVRGELTDARREVQHLLARLYDKASNEHRLSACDFADLLARCRIERDALLPVVEAARELARVEQLRLSGVTMIGEEWAKAHDATIRVLAAAVDALESREESTDGR